MNIDLYLPTMYPKASCVTYLKRKTLGISCVAFYANTKRIPSPFFTAV